MDQSSLDQLLQQRQGRVAPSLPGAFSQNVLREIRRRTTAHEPVVVTTFWQWLGHPRFAFAALVVAGVVGVSVGGLPALSPGVLAHEALDLQVFGGDAASLPSTLLAATR